MVRLNITTLLNFFHSFFLAKHGLFKKSFKYRLKNHLLFQLWILISTQFNEFFYVEPFITSEWNPPQSVGRVDWKPWIISFFGGYSLSLIFNIWRILWNDRFAMIQIFFYIFFILIKIYIYKIVIYLPNLYTLQINVWRKE